MLSKIEPDIIYRHNKEILKIEEVLKEFIFPDQV